MQESQFIGTWKLESLSLVDEDGGVAAYVPVAEVA